MAAGSVKHPSAWSRFFRRLVRPFLTQADKEHIAKAIREMEKHTSGEIHVHIVERVGKRDILDVARRIFHELGMYQTEHRNAVLVLISHLDHRFAIWGDEGIHGRAGQEHWERAKGILLSHFKARQYALGIEACIREIGRELAVHFPRKPTDGHDQISNDVTES